MNDANPQSFVPQSFVEELRAEMAKQKRFAERAIAQVDDAAFVEPLGAGTGAEGNSLALLVKHLAGNLRSRWTDFLTTDGEKPDRHRDREFELEPGDDRASLTAAWEHGWSCFLGTLDGLVDGDLGRTVTIRGEPHSVPLAIARAAGHAAYHVGQIVQLARLHAGSSWQTLSIARGESTTFNAELNRRWQPPPARS